MMNSETFNERFQTVWMSLPDYMKDSISGCIDRFSIDVQIHFSDEIVGLAEKKNRMIYPACLLLVESNNWHFAFREILSSSPEKVLDDLIRHEIIHAFLISEERLPTNSGQRELSLLQSEGHSSCDDEDLIGRINVSLGADERTAGNWLKGFYDRARAI